MLERGKFWFQSLPYTKKQHLCHCPNELMTYFTEVVDDDRMKRVKKRCLKPIEFLS